MPLRKNKRNLARCVALYHRLYNKIMEGQGYQPFGWDWPTLWATRPALAKALSRTIKIGKYLEAK